MVMMKLMVIKMFLYSSRVICWFIREFFVHPEWQRSLMFRCFLHAQSSDDSVDTPARVTKRRLSVWQDLRSNAMEAGITREGEREI